MKPACLRAERLLQQRAAGLSQAEGLRLEDHLSDCDVCRDTASLLSGLGELHAHAPTALPEAARRRAIQSALEASTRSPRTRTRPLLRPALYTLAVAAALAVIAVFTSRSHQRLPEPLVLAAAPVAPGDRILQGTIEVAGSERAPGQALAAKEVLHTRAGAQIALGHATVELRAATSVLWDPSLSELRLVQGSALLDVDPSQHKPFSVRTPGFDVTVLGTRFEVTMDGVDMMHGRVRVQPRGDAAPVVLEAGGQTQFRLTTNDAAVASAQQPDSSARSTHPPTRSGPPTAQWLARARSELAARDVESARATLTQALAQAKSRSERAEALTLQAEYELVAGSGASASIAAEARYLRVAEEFSPLRAAQTALFAAARLAAERGDRGRASELFGKYLARYPRGSFAKEARERLLHLTR